MEKYYAPEHNELIEYILSEKHYYQEMYPSKDKIMKVNIDISNIVDTLDDICNIEGDRRYIDPKVFKLKYLDREDIESLGFKYCKAHAGTPAMEFELGDYSLSYDPDFKGEQYLHISVNGDLTCFSGNIKNKSELRRLLKQLQII